MAQHPYRRAMAQGRIRVASENREQAAAAMHAAQDAYHEARRAYVEAAIAEQHAEVALRHATLGLRCDTDGPCWACDPQDADDEEARP